MDDFIAQPFTTADIARVLSLHLPQALPSAA